MPRFNTKIVLIGEPRVGKTSLRRTYIGKSFKSNYLQTIGADFSVSYIEIGDTKCQNALWDIAGQDKYDITYGQYFRGAQAAIITYDVSDISSYEKVRAWLSNFIEYSNIGKVVSIVGNKIDLCSTMECISEEEQQKFVLELSEEFPLYNINSYRTSAKTGENIQNCVYNTVKNVLDSFKLSHPEIAKKKLDFNNFIKASYLTSYDEITGPTIIKKSPNLGAFSDKEFINSIKVASTIDIDSLGDAPNVEGSMPWNDPAGDFQYIAFTDILSSSNKIYIIGFVNTRVINDLISSKYDLISGYFHKAMNEFNFVLKNSEMSLEELSGTTVQIDDILLNLRINIFKTVENEI